MYRWMIIRKRPKKRGDSLGKEVIRTPGVEDSARRNCWPRFWLSESGAYDPNYWLQDWETRSLVSSLIQEIFKQCSRNSCFQRIKLLLQVMHSSKVPSPWFNTEFVTAHTPFSTLNIFHSFHSLLSDTRETTTATGILLPLTYANQKTATLMPAVLRIQNLAALDWELMRDQHTLLNAKVC